MKDLAQLTLKEVAAAIRRRKLSSVELTRSLLERIARWQPALNAFVRVEAEDALAAAKAADRRALAPRGEGPLRRAARPQGHVLPRPASRRAAAPRCAKAGSRR